MEALRQAHPSSQDGVCVIVGDDHALAKTTANTAREIFNCTTFIEVDEDRLGFNMIQFPSLNPHLRCVMAEVSRPVKCMCNRKRSAKSDKDSGDLTFFCVDCDAGGAHSLGDACTR